MASTTTGYRKSIYDDFVYDQPETPNDNTSTFGGAFSPIVDAVRYAKKEGTRDWERLFGSFSKWASSGNSSTPKRVEGNKITKRRPEKLNSLRRRASYLSADDNESTSLTPVLERHSLYRERSFESEEQEPRLATSVPRSPLRYRPSIFGSTTHSVDSRAPTPSLDGSVIHSDNTLNYDSMYNNNNNNNIQENNDDENDEEQILAAYKSPIRSNFHRSRPLPVAVPMSSASTPLRPEAPYSASKTGELARLDRLQERLDEIRIITKTLARPIQPSKFASISAIPQQDLPRLIDSHISSPLRNMRKKDSNMFSPKRQQSVSLQPSPVRSQSTPSLPPPGSVAKSISMLFGTPSASTFDVEKEPQPSALALPPPPPPPPPPAPSSSYTAVQNKKRPESANKTPMRSVSSRTTTVAKPTLSSPSSSIDNQTGSCTPNNAMRNVLSDIPKAKLRSTETFRTPNGSRINNRFWKEIQAAKNQSTVEDEHEEHRDTPLLSKSTPLRYSRSSSVRKGKSPAYMTSTMDLLSPMSYHNGGSRSSSNLWEEGDFWTQASPNPSNSFTDKLKRIAQEENEEREWNKRLSMTGTPGSLGDELNAATRKEQRHQREKERAQVESSLFSLEPVLDDGISEKSGGSSKVRRIIDGDEWTFAGKQYSVNEKKRKL